MRDRARALRFADCFNKSKDSLRPVGEALTEHFVRGVEGLGAWALGARRAAGFAEFLEGSTRTLVFFAALMTRLLRFWAEERFFKVCFERLLFKVLLVWNAFFARADQVRRPCDCRS